jgi:urease accessory protein
MTLEVGPAPALDRVGRDGFLDLAFALRGARTIVTRSRWTVPLQVMAPLALDDSAAVVSILNPTGGLVGGDRLAIDVEVDDGAHACLTTPSATKVYRTAGDVSEQRVRLRVGRGATLEWVPDHTIPYAGSAFRQSIDVEVAAGAALVLVDAFSAGRVARGEAWRFRWLESRVAICDDRGPVLHDRFVLDGGDGWDRLGFAESHPYFGSVVVVAAGDLSGLVAAIDRGTAAVPDAIAATARLSRRGVVVRCLAADAPALTDVVDAAWGAARIALGRAPLALRKP